MSEPVFTDEEKDSLKKNVAQDRSDGRLTLILPFYLTSIEGLLHRLACAEKIVADNENYLKGLSLQMDADLREWRRSAGK